MPSLLNAPNLTAPHGFTTRLGGYSEAHFASLNLGLSTGDDPAVVAANRERVLKAFGVTRKQVCVLQQVHGARVVKAQAGWHEVKADAAVTSDPDLLLVIGTADCAPLLFHDPVRGFVGAAHAGWRGTVAGIAANVVKTLAEGGSSPADLQVAIGPSIAGGCYQVGLEVKEAFDAAGFPESVYAPDGEAHVRLDIIAANRYALTRAGVPGGNIFDLGECTHCDPDRFYSHRRDGLRRGSHWAVIKLGKKDRG